MKYWFEEKECPGLFQTDNPVGFVFPIIKDEGGKIEMERIPCHNNDLGQIDACQMMDQENFIEWAIDPWTGVINLELI